MEREVTKGYILLKDVPNRTKQGVFGDYYPAKQLSIQEFSDKMDETVDLLHGIHASLKVMGQRNGDSDEIDLYDFRRGIASVATALNDQISDLYELSCELSMADYIIAKGETLEDKLFAEELNALIVKHSKQQEQNNEE